MIKNKNYHLKFFDGFKDIDLYNYFIQYALYCQL